MEIKGGHSKTEGGPRGAFISKLFGKNFSFFVNFCFSRTSIGLEIWGEVTWGKFSYDEVRLG